MLFNVPHLLVWSRTPPGGRQLVFHKKTVCATYLLRKRHLGVSKRPVYTRLGTGVFWTGLVNAHSPETPQNLHSNLPQTCQIIKTDLSFDWYSISHSWIMSQWGFVGQMRTRIILWFYITIQYHQGHFFSLKKWKTKCFTVRRVNTTSAVTNSFYYSAICWTVNRQYKNTHILN